MAENLTFTIPPQMDGHALPALLRKLVPGLSWSQAKRAITGRRVEINGTLCIHDVRRLQVGDVITLHAEALAPVPREQSVRILHIDPDVIIVDKPPGIITVRSREEDGFTDEQKDLQPTLEEVVRGMLPGGRPAKKRRRGKPAAGGPPVYVVHRLDRNTSGLMLFALSVRAREAFIDLFSRHVIDRTYRAVAMGKVEPMTIESWIVRDRGDGIRGSLALPAGLQPARDIDAKRAVTHVRPLEAIGDQYTIIQCRLETGRTHQIRIHLAESGHMLCGERLYIRPRSGAPVVEDPSTAPRQALHSAELRFTHPFSKRLIEFSSAWPKDLQRWLEALRGAHPRALP